MREIEHEMIQIVRVEIGLPSLYVWLFLEEPDYNRVSFGTANQDLPLYATYLF